MFRPIIKIRPGHLPNFSSSGGYLFLSGIFGVFISMLISLVLLPAFIDRKVLENIPNKDFISLVKYAKKQLILLAVISFAGIAVLILTSWSIHNNKVLTVTYFAVTTVLAYLISAIIGIYTYLRSYGMAGLLLSITIFVSLGLVILRIGSGIGL